MFVCVVKSSTPKESWNQQQQNQNQQLKLAISTFLIEIISKKFYFKNSSRNQINWTLGVYHFKFIP